jgi:YVTN family beta-propeller protein
MSDGSERIYFRNPKTFDVERTIEVYTDQGPIARLNELEFVDGLIYANIWTSNNVAVIDPATGKVIATIDATQLVIEGKGNGEVLNGIAYNSATKKLYMTGKFWSKMFEVKVNKGTV